MINSKIATCPSTTCCSKYALSSEDRTPHNNLTQHYLGTFMLQIFIDTNKQGYKLELCLDHPFAMHKFRFCSVCHSPTMETSLHLSLLPPTQSSKGSDLQHLLILFRWERKQRPLLLPTQVLAQTAKWRKRERVCLSVRLKSMKEISKWVGRSLKLFIGHSRMNWEEVAAQEEVTIKWQPCPRSQKG